VNRLPLAAAPSEAVGNPLVNIAIFLLFVAVTLVVVFRASKNTKTAADYYAAGRSFTGGQNGTAIAGDYLSAASFLGIAGAIAVNGYDGFLFSIGFLVAWLVALLLVAELLRNVGKFTMADVLSFRLRQRPVRVAAATATLSVSFFYLLAQMAGAGGLVALLLNVQSRAGQSLVIAVVGALMIVYVLVGGMKGTTWVQIIKATLLIAGAGIMTIWVLAKAGFNLSRLLGTAVESAGNPALLEPMVQYGATGLTKLNFISLALALVLGTAGLPHVLMRFYTVPTAKEARRSVVWAIALIGLFYLFTLVLGYGAMAYVGQERILAAPGGANSAAPLLAYELGGSCCSASSRRSRSRRSSRSWPASPSPRRPASPTTSTPASSRRARATPTPRSRSPATRWSSSASSRSSAASRRTGRTSPSSSRSPSRSRPAPTCRPSSTRCSGPASTPAAPCSACGAA
jgi:cation/acetate symporter